jgi:hypothetical protein
MHPKTAPSGFAGSHFHPAVIVTMIAVEVVQVALHQVIDMVAMGHSFVAAVGSMSVRLFMPVALVVRCASFRILRVHLQAMVVDMIAVCIVHMTIMQIVRMPIVLHRRMAAILPMLVGVRP